jgi:Flp pilus assembly protein TadG
MLKRTPRKGLAVVELAIIVPVLVFLTIGMIEVARGLMVKETLSNAARKGARTGILPTGTTASITADINQVLSDNKIDTNYATVTVMVNGKVADASTAVQHDQISVKVSVPVSKVAWITPLFLPGSDIESDTLIMMRQR